MESITRRSFLKLGVQLSAVMGLGASAAPQLAEALEKMATGAAPVIWLQGQSCSGCTVSLLDSQFPGPAALLTEYINLLFHQTLSTATGHMAVDTLAKAVAQGGYILCVEGAVPAGMPSACRFGEEDFGTQLLRAVKNAKAVVAVGTCAAHGGIPAAEGNPTGAVSVPKYLADNGVKTPVIRIPGCPSHPEWILGTLVHVIKFGMPELNARGEPKMFFSKLVHDQCTRFADYEREHFARAFGEPGCLFKLGCLGVATSADCNVRLWNSGTNTCIRAGAPCIGCASADFVAHANVPLTTLTRAREVPKN